MHAVTDRRASPLCGRIPPFLRCRPPLLPSPALSVTTHAVEELVEARQIRAGGVEQQVDRRERLSSANHALQLAS